MPTLQKSAFIQIKEWLLVTLGILIYVTAWSVFLIPNNLIGGGVSGISSMIQYATGGTIQMGYSYFVLNAILVMVPPTIIKTLAIDNGKLLSVLMGGLLAGIGIGMSISNGGSTGGTDIIALIWTKYHNVSPGKVILLLDFIIIGSSLFIPSYVNELDAAGQPVLDAAGNPVMFKMPLAEKVTTVLYGLILVTVNSYVLDMYISGSQQSVQLFILSKEYEKIADAISKEMHRGVTVLDGKGWYTKQETKVLMVLTRKTDLNLMLRYIKQLDPNAFLSVSSVNGVYGKGFDTIKK